MRVLAFPRSGIAYNDSFYQQVEQQGVEVIQGHWEGRWLLSNLKSSDIIHIHWPSFLYEPKGTIGTIFKSFIRFIALMIICRSKTKNIWWTAHNLYPHQRSRFPIFDRWARLIIIYFCEGILVHGVEAKQIVSKEFPKAKEKCVIIPHGNWINRYGPELPSYEAKKQIGINQNSYVYLLLGQCQPYKKIVELIETFSPTASEDDILIIAGKFNDQEYYNSVKEASKNDPRIIIDNRYIPEEKVSLYLSASDSFCIPYQEILTSGSAMLAISYGLPVISLSKGYLVDLIDKESGILIPELSPTYLSSALKEVKNKKWDKNIIKAKAQKHSFSSAANIFISNTNSGKF